MGIGIGLAFAAMSNLIVENVRPDQTGVATGMNTVMRSLGGAVGGQVVASILTAHVAGGLPAEEGFTVAFFFCAAAIGIGTLTGFLIPGRQAAPGAAAAHARTVEA